MRFHHLGIESIGYVLAPNKVTSAALEDRLNGAMARMRLPPRPIELLTGITERGFWERGQSVHEVATEAARRAIELAGIPKDRIGVLINTSVSRDFLEPSMASLVHGDLGLSAHCLNFDIANACLGFLNGIATAGQLIESGLCDYALIVDGESSGGIVDATLARLSAADATNQDFWDNFATLTLGSAAVAMVLTRDSLSRTSHRVNGYVTRADTANSRLCLGTSDRMVTESTRLLKAGVALARDTWGVAMETLPGWNVSNIDQYICHQVGKSHMLALCQSLDVPYDRCFMTFPTIGNVGPAAVPLTLRLAEEAGRVRPGDHVALMGIGSGLNVSMMSVTW